MVPLLPSSSSDTAAAVVFVVVRRRVAEGNEGHARAETLELRVVVLEDSRVSG